MSFPGWKAFERYIADTLELDATITSGNKFFDPGDAVTRGRGTFFPLYADCKYTEHASMSLKLSTLRDLTDRATGLGKRMIMPIRLWPPGGTPGDYVVIGLHDFAELLARYRESERALQEGDWG